MRIEKQGQKIAIVQAIACLSSFFLYAHWIFLLGFFFSILFWMVSYQTKKVFMNFEKKISQEKSDKETVFDALLEGVVVVDDKMQIQHVNGSASRIFGLSKRHLIGKPFPKKEDSLLFQKSEELLETCQRLHFPATDFILSEKGKKIHLDLIATPKLSGNGAVLIFQDKSSQHKVLEMGKDFVASASHELKTPITIIRGFAETLQDMKNLPKEIEEEILEKIVRNCQRMDVLIRNLLTLADIENIPFLNYKFSDLGELVDECKRIVLTVYPKAQIHVIKDLESIMAEVDPSLLELAVLNLLNNAAKYSSGPAEIVVSIRHLTDEIVMTICDKGIGIPAQDLEHVFERFYTVNKAHSRKLGGAGLGLSLVKTILEKHDGSIQVESVLGEGSTFTLTFPVSQGIGICR